MKIILAAISGILVLLSFCAQADDSAVPLGDKDACMQGPLAEFGQYIGNWDIHDSQLSKDGSEWTDGAGARWNFVCIGDGTAIQDFWMPNGGPVGTNLRTYDSTTESWEIVWAVKPKPGLTHITASKDDIGNVVMHVKIPLPDPLRRITFFPATAEGWKWKLEFSTDDGASWFEVYRIVATPSDS